MIPTLTQIQWNYVASYVQANFPGGSLKFIDHQTLLDTIELLTGLVS